MSNADEEEAAPIPLLIGLSVAELGEADLLVLRLDCVTRIGRGPMVDRQFQMAMSRKGLAVLGEALLRAAQDTETVDPDVPAPDHDSRPN